MKTETFDLRRVSSEARADLRTDRRHEVSVLCLQSERQTDPARSETRFELRIAAGKTAGF